MEENKNNTAEKKEKKKKNKVNKKSTNEDNTKNKITEKEISEYNKNFELEKTLIKKKKNNLKIYEEDKKEIINETDKTQQHEKMDVEQEGNICTIKNNSSLHNSGNKSKTKLKPVEESSKNKSIMNYFLNNASKSKENKQD